MTSEKPKNEVEKIATNNDNINNINEDSKEELSIEHRIEWLRERGVQIETPEERKRQQVAAIINSNTTTNIEEDDDSEIISYVLVPADTSKPLRELTFRRPKQSTANSSSSGNDLLFEHLKNVVFQQQQQQQRNEKTNVDLELFKKYTTGGGGGGGGGGGTTTLLASSSNDDSSSSSIHNLVSEEALQHVAQQVNIEIFSLVRPLPNNQYTGINIYLDEVGMLKRLPLNPRASEYALQAGYNPPPQFYGDVYLGRIQWSKKQSTAEQKVIQNLSFALGYDTSKDALWLQTAAADNISYQMEMNSITGVKDQQQPTVAGYDGHNKEENGYTWTQTESEIEIVVQLPLPTTTATSAETVPTISKKDIQVQFHSQSISVLLYKKEPILLLQLFERIDLDSCTWTIDNNKPKKKSVTSTPTENENTQRLIISMEKVEHALWPRIED